MADTYAWTSPYDVFWLEHYFSKQATNLFGRKIVRESDLRKCLADFGVNPSLMLMGNFVLDRAGIVSLCREAGIPVVHGEDGFFPHYTTMHGDPLGFCWESSLVRMVYGGVTTKQRAIAHAARRRWLETINGEMDQRIGKRFVLWPLQLIGDRVNRSDLDLNSWVPVLTHFRRCLPQEIQLVIKEHPRSKPSDAAGVAEFVRSTPNVLLVSKEHSLKPLLQKCAGVAGVNSSVLYEARLMFYKPAYVYGRGWFTNHDELFMPVRRNNVRELGRSDWLADPSKLRTPYLDGYTDWFLYQMLVRQIERPCAAHSLADFKAKVWRLSSRSFAAYGEELFD